jgi:AraC-like DNA-binding protein
MNGPLYQKIHLKDNKSFNILKVDRPYFIVPWHVHPELEIMLVTSGHGTRFVGDSMESFKPYDLVMVGPNLPHVWKNGHEHYDENSCLLAEARVILFRDDCFGNGFFNMPEMKAVKELFIKAERGLRFEGKTKEKIAKKIIKAYAQQGIAQFLCLIEILDQLSKSKEYSFLSSNGYNQKVHASDLQRLNMVIDFIMKNFRKEITLDQVASVASMAPTALCRYFKGCTNKTLVQFINELRIGYAHKLLMETSNNVEQVCFDCGFNNVSNFYEQFKKITGKSPFKYRKEHSESVF